MNHLSTEYWENRWQNKETGWDIGYVSPALKLYFDQLEDKEMKILIPGAGNAYEAEYLYRQGFKNITVVDFSSTAIRSFLKRVPSFPPSKALVRDFFKLEDLSFDLIIEQAFYCAIDPILRDEYLEQTTTLLAEGGKLVGLLFQKPDKKDGPPFGGRLEIYRKRFSHFFKIHQMDLTENSIKPRLGTEIFFVAEKKK